MGLGLPLARKGFIILFLKGKTLPGSMVLKTLVRSYARTLVRSKWAEGDRFFSLNIGR